MMKSLRTGVIQLTSSDERSENLQKADFFLAEASQLGCTFVVLPEAFSCFCEDGKNPQMAENSESSPSLNFLQESAAKYALFLVGGSIFMRETGQDQVKNRSYFLGPEGNILGFYDKIHLFDVELSGGPVYRESATVSAGDLARMIETPMGGVGMSICYDLRFPELYRALVNLGSKILVVPSAFTQKTGVDHWEPLLRARAIENQCYVLAANQCGDHENGLRTSGRSMIIDPWGTVLAQAPHREALIVADLNLEHVDQVRQSLPCLTHRRLG